MKPLIAPQSDWQMPVKLIDFSQSPKISIDLETSDPDLKKNGPGWAFNSGHVAGVAIAGYINGELVSAYYPVGHYEGQNFDKAAIVRYLNKQLSGRAPKIMFNCQYDLGWLDWMGVKVEGEIFDPMLAGALLDEHRSFFNLDSLSKDYLGEKKNEDLLYDAAKAFGLKDVKGEMWKLPVCYVGPYAEIDAELALKLDTELNQYITEEGLEEVYQLERRQIRPIFHMRKRGVRVDVEKAEKLGKVLKKKEINLIKGVTELSGVSDIDIWSNLSLSKVYDKMGIEYPMTEKGNPSFAASFLEKSQDPISVSIVEARRANRARSTFSSGLITQHSKNGRIHCQFNQLRGDDYGTVSGRYSSSTPNLQQIPARDPEIGPLIRSLFIPEEGMRWCKADYSQQEPRLTVHYSYMLELLGAAEAVEKYSSADADFHQITADMANIERSKAKTINLGLAYGMGQGKLAGTLGLDTEAAKALFEKYHNSVPFMKALSYACNNLAQDRGYIKTLLGRHCRFPFWESADWDLSKALTPDRDKQVMVLRVGEAIDSAIKDKQPIPRGGVRRAFTYRAMNRLIQGSAADMTKKALADCYDAGFLPHLQVHDELDFSVEGEKQARAIKEIMENAVKLAVPVKSDVQLGDSWGELEKALEF